MSELALSYNKRCVDFFFKSIQDLKSQSGGQRWNEICEDVVDLFFKKFPKELGNNPFTKEEVWRILFDSSKNQPHEVFRELSKTKEFVCFLFLILQALLDPPAEWWRSL
jgi:hypothetical protein